MDLYKAKTFDYIEDETFYGINKELKQLSSYIWTEWIKNEENNHKSIILKHKICFDLQVYHIYLRFIIQTMQY